jgi:hypothetical protein
MAKVKERENRLLFVNATESGDPCMDGEVLEAVRGLGWIRGIVVSFAGWRTKSRTCLSRGAGRSRSVAIRW